MYEAARQMDLVRVDLTDGDQFLDLDDRDPRRHVTRRVDVASRSLEHKGTLQVPFPSSDEREIRAKRPPEDEGTDLTVERIRESPSGGDAYTTPRPS